MTGLAYRRRVAVTGLGVVAPNGADVETFWNATRNGVGAINTIDHFETSDFNCRIAARIRDFDANTPVPPKIARLTDRSTHFALAAAAMALNDSGLDVARENPARLGVSVGTGVGGILFYEEQLLAAQRLPLRKANPTCVPRIMPNAPASYIAMQHGFRGPNLTTCTACSSGGHAIGQGFRMVATGDAEASLCGGTEACIVLYTFRAFDAMRVMSSRNDEPGKASRPFDAGRDGFVMGEGSGMLVLEEMTHARERGAQIYAEVLGYGASAGAHHIVIPVADGGDAAQAMKSALADADLLPEAVDYVNAHGTSTHANDRGETLAIRTVFGSHADRLAVSSTKSLIGHTIGAAGAIEAIVCCLTLRDQFVHPTVNQEKPDPECDLDYVPNTGRPKKVDVAMSNSFGFGNNNAVLVLGKER